MKIRDDGFAGSRDADQSSLTPSFDSIINTACLHICCLERGQHFGAGENDHPAGMRTDLEAYTLQRYTFHRPWSPLFPYQGGSSSST